MSIVRWGVDGSDVYIYSVEEGIWECCACKAPGAKENFRGNEVEMLTHLDNHRKKGDCVPDWVDEYFKEGGPEE